MLIKANSKKKSFLVEQSCKFQSRIRNSSLCMGQWSSLVFLCWFMPMLCLRRGGLLAYDASANANKAAKRVGSIDVAFEAEENDKNVSISQNIPLRSVQKPINNSFD